MVRLHKQYIASELRNYCAISYCNRRSFSLVCSAKKLLNKNMGENGSYCRIIAEFLRNYCAIIARVAALLDTAMSLLGGERYPWTTLITHSHAVYGYGQALTRKLTSTMSLLRHTCSVV